MDNLLNIAFEAHCTEKNHHRRYQITIGLDLLNDWTVGIYYGRCGQRSQQKRFASAKSEEMRTLIRSRLNRRISAPRRIGCAYRLAEYSVAPGFDPFLWLPDDLMAKFFKA